MKIKTICLWCGKGHKQPPPECKRLLKLARYAAKRVEVWKVMAVVHRLGTSGLERLVHELKEQESK